MTSLMEHRQLHRSFVGTQIQLLIQRRKGKLIEQPEEWSRNDYITGPFVEELQITLGFYLAILRLLPLPEVNQNSRTNLNFPVH